MKSNEIVLVGFEELCFKESQKTEGGNFIFDYLLGKGLDLIWGGTWDGTIGSYYQAVGTAKMTLR